MAPRVVGCIYPISEVLPPPLSAGGIAESNGEERRAGAGRDAGSVPHMQGHQHTGGESTAAL